MINKEIKKLVSYGINKKLISSFDITYITNQIISALGLNSFEDCDISNEEICLESILNNINDFLQEKSLPISKPKFKINSFKISNFSVSDLSLIE